MGDSILTDPSGAILIPLNSKKFPNLFAIADSGDADIIGNTRWSPLRNRGGNFYAQGWSFELQRVVKMHRLLLDAQPGEVVDHKNKNTLDNRRDNLRIATHQQNAQNRRATTGSASSYKGVSRAFSGLSGWAVNIKIRGKRIYLGRFQTEEEAAMMYDLAAMHFHGDFALLNLAGVEPTSEVKDRWRFICQQEGIDQTS